ncbi:L-threonylcarbamoyladenylate synthase [Basilea psittacipulmonis]|uniref:Threonylcarbamoyl-AMP synthase n=1 Tax=Basilea psittacipulmonis DSM 24701 TaxID=1072685 RepID=A0A077DBR6_9BURK|nr:L-threonylcarbamoyladenylate synthase [Basilea psittacipulmonis]AIL32260.1 translation factor Sua5 [Basilea psittacipulmonis DSM 24701]
MIIHDIDTAAQLLNQGQLLAFPTETVYGLGADAENVEAVSQIYRAKNRPVNHPLIVHLASDTDVAYWAATIPYEARCLIDAFWPGPLTLILPRAAHIPSAVAGGQDSIGLRCPSHPTAQKLLKAFSDLRMNAGVAAPSANKFGKLSPTAARHVIEEFTDDPSVNILVGEESEIGIESTILDVSRITQGIGATLLRPGHISREDIAQVLGYLPLSPDQQAPRASGTLKAHYAPRTPLRLYQAGKSDLTQAIVLTHVPLDGVNCSLMPNNAKDYAHELYARLHQLDKEGYHCIYVNPLPQDMAWEGVRDRVNRALAAF